MSSVMLVALEFFLSILPLIPHLEWTFQWGKLYHSLALADAGVSCHVKIFFSYDLINENNALITALIQFVVLCIVTGLAGMFLFAVSVGAGRTAAMLAGTFFAVLAVVFENLYLWQAWIGFISPFSWMNLLLLYGKVCKPAPSFSVICGMAAFFGMLLCAFSLKAVKAKDLNWIDEE